MLQINRRVICSTSIGCGLGCYHHLRRPAATGSNRSGRAGMAGILGDFISLRYGFPAKEFFVAAGSILVLILATASLLSAEVTGTAGFETGLQRLASVSLNKSFPVKVVWDDGDSDDGLLVREKGANFDIYGTHRYKTAGVYTIKISYRKGVFGKKETVTTTATISAPQDFVILSIGDSVASGEGDTPVPKYGFWDDPGSDYKGHPCHRSMLAGPALAAQKVRETNPITFIHVACSGNTVEDAIQQLRNARATLSHIDVLTISAGANDLHGMFGKKAWSGFAAVVKRCITHQCSKDAQFAQDIHDSIEGNPDRDGYPGLASLYSELNDEIHCTDPASNCDDPQNQIPKLVLIAEYHDPTHDKKGQFPKDPIRCADPGITAKEFEFLYDNVMLPLNKQVNSSPWNAVTGIQAAFLKHGLCALNERWVDTIPDSIGLQGDDSGTGHPNYTGQQEFETQIYDQMIALNPPVTTVSATAGDSSYTFGTWTNEDVVMTLMATNGIKESGVGTTFYAVDNPNCIPGAVDSCLQYSGPFTVSASAQHTVTFFSANKQTGVEALQSVQVWVDKNPPVAAAPAQQMIHQGDAVYTVTVGHFGWENGSVNLSCTTNAPLATCTMIPTFVSLDPGDPNTAAATVAINVSGMVLGSGAPAPSSPLGPREALGILLALSTTVFLPAMVLRRPRFDRARNMAGLAILVGLLCTNCGRASGAKSQSGTPPGTYDVTITGVSGDTSNTCHAVLTVQ